MTEEDRQRFHEALNKIEHIHHFLMEPRAPGKKSRAEEIDDALSAIRAGKAGARLTLWLAGAVTLFTTTYGSMKGWWMK